MTTLLEVRNLTQRFGGLTAVDQVSFAIEAGRVSAVIGPNGAGKTTLFNLISGFQRPVGGSIAFEGRDITGLAPHRIAAEGLVRTFQLVQLFSESDRPPERRGGLPSARTGRGLGCAQPAPTRS